MTTRAYEPRFPVTAALVITLSIIVLIFHSAMKAGGVL